MLILPLRYSIPHCFAPISVSSPRFLSSGYASLSFIYYVVFLCTPSVLFEIVAKTGGGLGFWILIALIPSLIPLRGVAFGAVKVFLFLFLSVFARHLNPIQAKNRIFNATQ